MNPLTLDQANRILQTALADSRSRRLAPMTVAVLDGGGHLVACQREDGSGILRLDIACGKAYGALGFGTGSRALLDKPPAFLAAVAAASQGRMVPVPGGVLVRDADGRIVGAVGVSGDAPDADEAVAVAGIAACGLAADTGAPAA